MLFFLKVGYIVAYCSLFFSLPFSFSSSFLFKMFLQHLSANLSYVEADHPALAVRSPLPSISPLIFLHFLLLIGFCAIFSFLSLSLSFFLYFYLLLLWFGPLILK